MPGRRTAQQQEPQITRKDIMEAVGVLSASILDQDSPVSLISMLNGQLNGLNRRMDEHDRKVEAIRGEFADFKQAYAGDRGKAKGLVAGLSVAGGAVGAAAAKFFKLF